VAITATALLTWFVFRRADEAERRGHPWPGRIILGVVVVQVALGFMHIALGSPLASALLHLFLAQTLWIAFVLLALNLLEPPDEVPARP
jgi:heme A synthase